MSSKTSEHDSAAAGMDAELTILKKSYPEFSFLKASAQPCLIHVIDSRLIHLSKYPLNQTIKKLDCSGPIQGLANTIAEMGIPLTSGQAMSTDQLLVADMSTGVTVHAADVKVRDALTNYVDLANYWPLIWVATTEIRPDPQTDVLFMGRRPSASPQQK